MTVRAQTIGPLYSEAQGRRWLAWLARGMRRHGETVFQIEGLQPTWLSSGGELKLFILSTRLVWGFYVGLIFGLINGLTHAIDTQGFAKAAWQNLSVGSTALSAEQVHVLMNNLVSTWVWGLSFGLVIGMILGLLSGLALGLVCGLVDSSFFRRHRYVEGGIYQSGTTSLIRGIGVACLLGAVISVSLGWLFDQIIDGLKLVEIGKHMEGAPMGVIFAAISGLAFGLIRTNRSVFRKPTDAIRPVEALRWRWRSSRSAGSRGAMLGLVAGLILGVFFGLIRGLEIELKAGLTLSLLYGLIDGLLGCLIGGLIGGFFGGFEPRVREMRTVPNQGIHLSIESAVRTGLPVGIFTGLIVGLIARSPVLGLIYFMLTALIIGIWYGGLEAIEHGLLRVILAVRDHAPLNYVRFLDYAADGLNFLQKVGGGYVFVHRYLLEYFAELEAAEYPRSAGVDLRNAHDDAGIWCSPPIR